MLRRRRGVALLPARSATPRQATTALSIGARCARIIIGRDGDAGRARALEKERHLHELQLQQRQLTYLLERCNAYATQATLATGFAFTAFSAEALKDLDYVHRFIFSFTFVLSGAVTMTLSIGVLSSSYLMGVRAALDGIES